MLIIQATSPDALEVVTDFIHDFWFDVEEISFVDGVVRVPFNRSSLGSSRSGQDLTPAELLVRHVTDFKLEDTQDIGRYDFNRIRCDENARRLTMDTGIPMRFEMLIAELDVSVEIGRDHEA